jgi:hypothetical protein
MNKTKILIERNLKFNRKYIYLSLTRGNIIDGNGTCCDNCGKIIANIVEVRDRETGKVFYIGTDCADTLIQAKCLFKGIDRQGWETDYQHDIYNLNAATRFITEVKAGCNFTFDGYMYYTLINRKGKEMRVFKSQLEDFYPEYLSQAITN